MVSRWGVACGIDDYVRDLVSAGSFAIDFVVLAGREVGACDDGAPRIMRDWDTASDDISELLGDLRMLAPDVVHVQFNWGMMALSALAALLKYTLSAGVPCILQLHATTDNRDRSLSELGDDLRRAPLVVVHGAHDAEHLASWGVIDNVWRWHLGERQWPQLQRADLRARLGLSARGPVVATFGFLQPRKGLIVALQATRILLARYPEAFFIGCCALHPRGFDGSYYLACRALAESESLKGRVALIPDYLPAAAAMALLQAADAVVLPYVDTPEGQSAAAKYCLAAGRPLIVSAEPLFDEYRDEVLTLDSVTPESVAAAVELIISEESLAATLAGKARDVSARLSWDVVAAEYVERIRVLLSGRV
jgi:glycosyltransferase involved in cell wall biosynthesis